ncbi:S24 family peptidase [Sphingomonas sp. SORGH_AS_0438]|uniref:XRE family transcriptional regulator n=1 Tax=Sphingomonas sp. SORGH_AS_0438 TaxID=3041756 RepID=UPI002865996F|nr:S24 family peptidase [Sphingomonas sp. SORGH_AS_0438]MDR6128063.1 phage repressor protein C with HTH and peptisase S24 domain [Sphingomonas sp. SORGH_AS_0438]
MINAERLAERMKAKGVSQTQLARTVGISQQAIGKLISGGSSTSRFLPQIARELTTTVDYLVGIVDDPTEQAVRPGNDDDVIERFDLVSIDEIDQEFGLGGAFTGAHVAVRMQYFPRAWVESITSSPPSMLTMARGRGDSMDPTIRDRDMVIIDRSRRKLDEQDAIWALAVGEMGMIKRLRLRGSTVVIQSDNDRVSDEEVHVDEVHLVGRVVFIGRRT